MKAGGCLRSRHIRQEQGSGKKRSLWIPGRSDMRREKWSMCLHRHPSLKREAPHYHARPLRPLVGYSTRSSQAPSRIASIICVCVVLPLKPVGCRSFALSSYRTAAGPQIIYSLASHRYLEPSLLTSRLYLLTAFLLSHHQFTCWPSSRRHLEYYLTHRYRAERYSSVHHLLYLSSPYSFNRSSITYTESSARAQLRVSVVSAAAQPITDN